MGGRRGGERERERPRQKRKIAESIMPTGERARSLRSLSADGSRAGRARLGLTVCARITKANYALSSKKGNHGKNHR